MNNKKKIIIIVTIILIFIIIISIFVTNIVRDKKQTARTMDLIEKEYQTFEKDIELFNSKRDEIYSQIFVETYYDTIKEKYQVWNNNLTEYEEKVDKIIKNSKNLQKYCNGIYYSKPQINQNCNNFASLYEEMINSFVTDINEYNKIIKNYNEYIKENNQQEVLSSYKTTKKYLDYNKDNNYSGKE